ncbi:Mus7/MMS22 family-domain-containing protein [Tuber brumale]|nr:Mus7/MMS22 family-domain-containing protein [Tuber brumale]
MANWRETGYVPASDDDISDGELSTQEELLGLSEPRTPLNLCQGDLTATSSPLSSPPSVVLTPPSIAAVRSPPRCVGFSVVIPAAGGREEEEIIIPPDDDAPQYYRSLRARKPIQKNPYLIEQERYRQTLKARGVRPVRISEVEEETNGGLGADEDSQERDYVAPPEPENDESQFALVPSRGRDGPGGQGDRPVDIYDFEGFPDAASTSRERPRPNGALADGVKRRKVNHTYSKRPHTSAARPQLNAGLGAGNAHLTPSSIQAEIDENGRDVYELSEDSPQRRSRTPLAQTSPNGSPTKGTPWQPTQEQGIKRRGILSLLDSSSDIESLPSGQGRHRPISPWSEDGDTPRARPERTVLELSSSPPEEEPTPSESEDESQEVRRLQRKTAGVLPASWWKLDKRQHPSSANDSRRDRRSSTPVQDLTPRPGVARARITSRPRSPVGDVFLFGDDSDDSSGPANIQPQAPPSGRPRLLHRQHQIEVIEIDDVVEDDRIDRMLSVTQRNSRLRKQKQRDQNGLSRAPQGMGGSRLSGARNSGSGSRLRQPRITNHIGTKRNSTKRKPKAPQLGIVDAVRHYRATNPEISPPTFLKVATRSARERRSKGRQGPSKKVFQLDTAADTQEVQSVLREWREGTIAIRAHDSSDEDPTDCAPPMRPLSPTVEQRPAGVLGLDLGLFSIGASAPRRQRPKQTTLTNIMRTRPLLSRINDAHRLRQKSRKRSNVTTVPARRNAITHRPFFMPEPAQFEREEPPSIAAARLRKSSRQGQRLNLTELLQTTARRHQNLARFMDDDDLVNPPPIMRSGPGPAPAPTLKTVKPPRPRRKRTPMRIDAETIERRQPPPEDRIIADDVEIEMIPEPAPNTALDVKPVLIGLLPYGSKYTLSFDTIPLKPGTIFNSETFIGSGGLSKALNSKLQAFSHSSSFRFGDKLFRWGVYEDSMAAEFESIMHDIVGFVDRAYEGGGGVEAHMWASRAYTFYLFFSNYLYRVISFSDSIDLISFGQRILQAINASCDQVLPVLGRSAPLSLSKAPTRLALQLHVFGLLFAFQIYKLASGDPGAWERLELDRTIRRLGHQLLGRLLGCGFDTIRECYEDQRAIANYERGIDPKHYLIEAWVIAIYALDSVHYQHISFWQLLNSELRPPEIERALDIRIFEKHWRIVWAILPLYQFDEFGVVQGPMRDGNLSENWALLRVLIGRPLKVYSTNMAGHSGAINTYCRTLYARCHHLIAKWGWLNTDIIIPVLYEFFASKSLANLRNEETYGSPDFLQNLDRNPSLEMRDSDPCFHLLLKVVGLGLHAMKASTPINKIGNLVNRLMPNHGRQYPKYEELRVENLTALRNHHDLLSTLWWASPPQCRPPLEAIRYLVDPDQSHQQACIVTIRAWLNLMRFQLHSGEGLDALKPFMGWFDHFTSSALNQHHAARNEAEKHFSAAKERGDTELTEDIMEDNIRRNQQQLEGILIDALKSLHSILVGIKGQTQSAIILLTKASTANVLNSYGRLSNKLIFEALNLIQQYLVVTKSADESAGVSVQAGEDSQDYGDWSGFDDIIIRDDQRAAAEQLFVTVYEALHRMLSNCFGSDIQPEDSLLIKTVDTWALVVGFLVRHGLKNWDAYLDQYNPESWSSLRDTEQTRKFTAYFIPKVIQSGPEVYESNKTTFISFWLKTLVERESLLKFQNEYTATLLNCDPTNPILANPPFVRDEVSGEFKITLTDFRARRLSLISTILANMRENYEETHNDSVQRALALKLDYSEMLKSMMRSMKEIYQVLYPHTHAHVILIPKQEIHAKSASGAYVEFVQQVVEYLQQHSIDIVTIDPFFTDSSVFPLPSADPMYVVGRLKNYGLKLSHQRMHKQLTSFFQSVCERAAIDGQQEYLVHQLTTALSGELEVGTAQKPSLRSLFIEAIFPAYIECTFTNPAGWILSAPLLQATEKILAKFRLDVDSTLDACVEAVTSMLTTLLNSIRASLSAHPTPEVLSSSVNTAIYSLFLKVLTRAIPLLDTISPAPHHPAYETAKSITTHAAAIQQHILNPAVPLLPLPPLPPSQSSAPHTSTKSTTIATLAKTLCTEWKIYNGIWYVTRPTSRREVLAPKLEVEAEELGRVVEGLLRVAARMQYMGCENCCGLGVWFGRALDSSKVGLWTSGSRKFESQWSHAV